jgi:hypothetical protein
MAGPLPILLIPGLLVTLRLYERQLPALWRLGPVTVADQLTRRRGRRSWPPASRGRGWSWWPASVT